MNLVDRALTFQAQTERQERIAREKRENADLNNLRNRLLQVLKPDIYSELGTTVDAYNGHNSRIFSAEFYGRDFEQSHIVHTLPYKVVCKETHDPNRTLYLRFTLAPSPDAVCCQLYGDMPTNQHANEEFIFSVTEQFLLSLASFLRDSGAQVPEVAVLA
jgi:hypothetical protein